MLFSVQKINWVPDLIEFWVTQVDNKCAPECIDMNASFEVQQLVNICSRNIESQPEAVIEHPVGRQGQPSGAQVHAMHTSDWKNRKQDAPFFRPHLRVGSEGEGISCQRSLPTWGLPKISNSFPSFLHQWLLRLGSLSFAVAKDFVTLLLSSLYIITDFMKEIKARNSFVSYEVKNQQ